MAFIKPENNDVIVVDAKLTRRGRQILSQGIQGFDVVKFALSDTQIDYSLQQLQTNIHEYPVFQPVLDGDIFMRNLLYTGVAIDGVIPQIRVDGLNIGLLNELRTSRAIIPNTKGNFIVARDVDGGLQYGNTQLYRFQIVCVDGTNPLQSLTYVRGSDDSTINYDMTGKTVFTIPNARSIAIARKNNLTTNRNIMITIVGETSNATQQYTVRAVTTGTTIV